MKLINIIRKAGFSTGQWEDINYDYKKYSDTDKYETIRCDLGHYIYMDIERKYKKPNILRIDIVGHIEEKQSVLDGTPLKVEFMEQVNYIRSFLPSSRILFVTASDSGIYKSVKVRGNKHLYVRRKKRGKYKKIKI